MSAASRKTMPCESYFTANALELADTDPNFFKQAQWRAHESGMLARCKSLRSVLEADRVTLQRLNVTPDQIANVLDSVLNAYINDGTRRFKDQFFVTACIGREAQSNVPFRSPFQHPDDSREWLDMLGDVLMTVHNRHHGSLAFTALSPHMIRQGFFGGLHCERYGLRVDPAQAVAFFNIKPQLDYALSVPTKSQLEVWRERNEPLALHKAQTPSGTALLVWHYRYLRSDPSDDFILPADRAFVSMTPRERRSFVHRWIDHAGRRVATITHEKSFDTWVGLETQAVCNAVDQYLRPPPYEVCDTRSYVEPTLPRMFEWLIVDPVDGAPTFTVYAYNELKVSTPMVGVAKNIGV